jgi:quercetin dioxygenase-like cupin family protein
MPRLQRKSLSTPDLVRAFPFGHVDVVNLDETSVARFTWEPGWRWSKDVAPVVKTTSCQNRHVGYVFSGVLHVQMDDGTELEIRVGDAFEIPPGHDAWVVGDEVFDTVEFTSAAVFGAAPDEDESVLATILFTDIVDSTSTLSRIGDAAWRRLVVKHNQVMRTELDRYRGREMGTTGDGFLALFDGAARAVRCANAMIGAVGERLLCPSMNSVCSPLTWPMSSLVRFARGVVSPHPQRQTPEGFGAGRETNLRPRQLWPTMKRTGCPLV